MSKLDTVLNTAAQKLDNKIAFPGKFKRIRQYLLDLLLIVGASIFLYLGPFLRVTSDATGPEPGKYRCYALAFWQGKSRLGPLLHTDCSFLQVNAPVPLIDYLKSWGLQAFFTKLAVLQPPGQALHALPQEYPLLSILPFTFAMLAPPHRYLLIFAICMALVVGVLYFVLKRYRSSGAALAFLVYLVVGSSTIALARFDIIPAGLTLGAVILADRARWRWAFALLALAVLLKFYALVLILPLFMAQQKQYSSRGGDAERVPSQLPWYSWQRWDGVGIFVAVSMLVTTISLILNVEGTLAPFSYFGARPIQVESLSAGGLWLGSFMGYQLHYVTSFGSNNVVSLLSALVSPLGSLCFVMGLVYVYWLQWRGKLDIFTASLLALLILVVTSKVFSPQYLVWVTPFVAYVGKSNWKWLLSWGSVGLLTTYIFPWLYVTRAHLGLVFIGQVPTFFPAVLARGLIMLTIIFALLYQATRLKLESEGVETAAIVSKAAYVEHAIDDRGGTQKRFTALGTGVVEESLPVCRGDGQDM